MSRMFTGLLAVSVLFALLTPGANAQNTTTALKAKAIAKEKLSPKAKAKPKAKGKAEAPARGKSRAKSQSKKPPKSLQQQADELQIKSDALTSLTELLTDRRAKESKRVEMMKAYLKSIGKLEDYENAKTPPPSNKGEMTYRHAVNTAINHVKQQGTTNMVDHPDEDEVKFLRRIRNANDRLAKKAWGEYAALRDQTRSMGAYLDSIDKAADYKKWAGVEADKQQQAYQKKVKEEREKEVAAYKTKRAKQQQERKLEAQKVAEERRQDRQAALQRRFQLRQDEIYKQMREHSPAQGGWGGWDDSYDDVHHHRSY